MESQLVGAKTRLMAVSSDAGIEVASHTGSVSAAALWKSKKNGHWDWWSPGQSTWDTFGMRRRIGYVPGEEYVIGSKQSAASSQ